MDAKRKVVKIGKILLLILLIGSLIAVINLNKRNELKDINSVTESGAEELILKINGFETAVMEYIQPVALYIDKPTVFDFSLLPKGSTVSIDGTQVDTSEPYEYQLSKIEYEYFIPIDINGNIYQLNTMNLEIPHFNTKTSENNKGVYYLTLDNVALKINDKGKIVFYLADKQYVLFERFEKNGKVRYVAGYKGQNINPSVSDAYTYMHVDILDETYNIIDTIEHLYGYDDMPKYTRPALDAHEFVYLDDGHYMLLGYVNRFVDNIPKKKSSSKVMDMVIQEVVDDEIVFDWHSVDYPELYNYSVEGYDYNNEVVFWADYMHTNSITIDPSDEDLIISSRNLDNIMKLDRKTGKIVWILGGKGDQFGLSEEQKFHRQHFARITNEGTLTLFNNGNLLNQDSYPIVSQEEKDELFDLQRSSVMEFVLDEKNKKVLGFSELTYNDYFMPVMGSATKTDNQTYVICWASPFYNGASLFSEVDYVTSKTIFELSLSDRGTTYRVHKYDE